MPSFIVIPSTDIDAKSPISDGLMGDIKNDLDFLLSVITARGGATIKTATGSYTAVTTKLKVTLVAGGGGSSAFNNGGQGAGTDSWFGVSTQKAVGGPSSHTPGDLYPRIGSNYFSSGSAQTPTEAGGIATTLFSTGNVTASTGNGGYGASGVTGGQAGEVATYWLTVTPGVSYTVTVGAGGAAGTGGGAGMSGLVIIEEQG